MECANCRGIKNNIPILDRQAFLQTASTSEFDICIIGGGATGAGCALDAQSRGWKTILIEREDFAAATSSKSTKLIHGGVRYLEQAVKKLSIGQFKMVRKALKERQTLLRLAPHITRPLQLITPCHTWLEGLYYFIGLKLYDWISGSTNIGSSGLLKKRTAVRHISTIRTDSLYSAVKYYDGQLDDQRYNLALIQTAVREGAICINHCEASTFYKSKNDKLQSVTVTDRLTGKQYIIKARVFINATGPFADGIRRMANPQLDARIQVSRGVHILLPWPMMPSQAALLIPQTKDGRLIFAIPYKHQLLVGTTDDATTLTSNEFGPTKTEVEYLLGYLNQYLNINAQPEDVKAGFGGLRPLIKAAAGSTKDLVRDHEVELDNASGLVSILGGKWTTYRLMAKDTIDAAELQLGKSHACKTDTVMLEGSTHLHEVDKAALLHQSGWADDIVAHLIATYGDKAALIVSIAGKDENNKKRISDELPYTIAELRYVVQHEMACTVKDVLARRWGLQLANWQQTLQLIPIVGEWMAAYFSWTGEQRKQYMEEYAEEVNRLKRLDTFEHYHYED